MMQFIPEIWKQYAVLLGIPIEKSNMNISEYFGWLSEDIVDDLKRVGWSNVDYKGTTARKPHW